MFYPRTFSHIGLSVPNIYEAMDFYSSVMGWYITMPVTTTKEEHRTPMSCMYQELFGPGYKEFKIAHLSTGDRIGIELFEFPDNDGCRKSFMPHKTGVFHYCVQDSDVEGLVQRILKAGGKQRSAIIYYYPEKSPYRMVYMEDPFGNVVEIYSHPYDIHYTSKIYH